LQGYLAAANSQFFIGIYDLLNGLNKNFLFRKLYLILNEFAVCSHTIPEYNNYYLHLVSIFTESELISVSWDPHDILDWTKNIEV